MSRISTGVKSSNINLDFESDSDVVLISKGGSVHIIGGFRPKNTTTLSHIELSNKEENTKKMVGKEIEDQAKESEVDTSREEEKPNTLRRSSRVRTVVPVEKSSKTIKKEKEAIKNMANYFNCEDLDDDEEDSYSEKEESISSSESEDESRMEEEFSEDSRLGRKKKTSSIKDQKILIEKTEKRGVKSKESGEFKDFSVPTRNPYE